MNFWNRVETNTAETHGSKRAPEDQFLPPARQFPAQKFPWKAKETTAVSQNDRKKKRNESKGKAGKLET